MTSNLASIALFLALVTSTTNAFTPTKAITSCKGNKWSTTYVPVKRVEFVSPPSTFQIRNAGFRCNLTSDADAEAAKLRLQASKLREENPEVVGVSVEELSAAVKSTDGTVYDDEPMIEAPRDNLSASMKERLMREASTGLDSNESQINVILYISIGVAILVLLGGQGILF